MTRAATCVVRCVVTCVVAHVVDRKVKVPLYARHRILEVWIVDLENGRLHFFRSREDESYSDISVTTELGIVPVPGLSGLAVDLGSLLKT
jgi:Uma2 family endonuclease